MKKLMAGLFALGLAITITACGQEEQLKQQISDLETKNTELQAQVQELSTAKQEFETKVQELETQLSTIAAIAVPDTTTAVTQSEIPAK